MQVNTASTAELGRMREKIGQVSQQFFKEYAPATVQLLNNELTRIRSAKN